MKRSELLNKIEEIIIGRSYGITDGISPQEDVLRIIEKYIPIKFDSEVSQLKEASILAKELCLSLRELDKLQNENDQDMLNCSMNTLSIYEKLMMSFETNMHPAHKKNLEEFRKTIPVGKNK